MKEQRVLAKLERVLLAEPSDPMEIVLWARWLVREARVVLRGSIVPRMSHSYGG